MSYKNLLSEVHGNLMAPSQSVLDKIKANQVLQEQLREKKALQARHETLVKDQKALATKMGISYSEWLKQAKKYYDINPVTFMVTSNARSSNTSESWPCLDIMAAQEKVLELIEYKYYDHFIKGHDFAWQ